MNNDHLFWQEIVDYLRGSCNTLDDALEAFEAIELLDNMDFLGYLDNQIFLCTECNWWCGLEEEVSADYYLDELTCGECCDEG